MSLPICPTDCTSSAPITAINDCNVDLNFGEIKYILISAEPITNWRTHIDDYLVANPGDTYEQAYADYEATICARISNDGVAQDAIRKICVRGEKTEAEVTPIRICGGQFAYPPKKHTVSYTIDDTGDVNYEALRQLECNGKFYVQYADEKYLYGDQEEGSAIHTILNWNHIIPLSYEELQSFVGVIEWEAQFHPARIEAPVC